MAASCKRKKSRTGLVIFIIIIAILYLNAGNIGRFLFPVPYRADIYKVARATGVDGSLLSAIMKTESSFNPLAVSPKGAIGLMQIMPETGEWIAEKNNIPDFTTELLFNPEVNIKVGALYIAELNKEYGGDTTLVLAAYNAGRGNVKKWLDQKRWTGKRSDIDMIPFPETRQFARKVLFYQQVYKRLYSQSQGF